MHQQCKIPHSVQSPIEIIKKKHSEWFDTKVNQQVLKLHNFIKYWPIFIKFGPRNVYPTATNVVLLLGICCYQITNYVTLSHAFPVVAAGAWNGLPDYVTSASTYASFRTALKTYLFTRTFWHWHHASHWLYNVVLKCCCACTTLIWSYDDDDHNIWLSYAISTETTPHS